MNAFIISHIKQNINLVHPSEPHQNKHLKKKYFFIFLLLNLNFSLLTYSQETPFPTDNLQLWLRADSVELTNGKVSRWYDLGPNNYVIQQTNANARPTVIDSAINDLPAISFNGTSTFLNCGNILNMENEEWTWIIVGNYISDGPCLAKWDRSSSFFNSGAMWSCRFKSFVFRYNANIFNSYTNLDSLTNSIVMYELFDRTARTSKAYLNGNYVESVTIPDVDVTNSLNLYIGGNQRTGTNNIAYLNGQIAEIIAFNTIDSILRNQVNDYLYSKYLATVSLGLDIHVPYGFCDTAITTAYNPDFISYQWSTGETDSVIHVNRSGRYTVTVTNSFGVTSTDDINIYFPEHFQLQDTTICANDTIYWNTELDENGYTFQWMKDETQYADASNLIEIFEAGAYTCIITDSLGCRIETDSLHVAIDDYPISTSFIADKTSSVLTDTAMCSGNTLGIATNIDETISYTWNTGAASSRITITESGDYTLTTANSRGCHATNSIYVNILGEAPEINIAIDNLCYGDSTSFICNAQSPQSIGSYLWIIDVADSVTADNFKYKFDTIGIHDIRTIVTSNNSCRTDSSFNINIKNIPYPNFTYTPVCIGIPMNFIGNSTIPDSTSIESYTWLINDSVIGTNENLTFDMDHAGIIPLKYSISLSNGCSSDTTIEVSAHSEYSEPRFVSPAYPTNGMLVSSDSITFSWNYDYDILYNNLITSPSADFSNADTIACTSNNITLPSENFTDTTYWKVSSYNHCLLSFESEPYFFRKIPCENDFFPTNPNLQLWLRADSVELTDGKVSRWYDLSPNNYVIRQTNANARPTVTDSAINDLPAISFNGTSTFLNCGNILNMENEEWTWIIVGNYISDGPCIAKWDRSSSFFNSGAMWSCRFKYFVFRYNANNFNSYTNLDSLTNCIVMYELFDRTARTSKAYLNGNYVESVTIPDVNVTNTLNLYIGGNQRTGTNNIAYLNGQIAEIIAFNTIDSTIRNQVNDYLYSKYLATVSLGLDIHIPYGFCDTTITTAYNPDFISYQWSTGETDSVIHVNNSGRYTVTVTNSFGVTSTDDINVYFPKHFQMQDTTICAGNSFFWNLKMRENDYSFQWFKDGAQLDNASNLIEISESGAYTCLITDTLGCSFKTDTVHIAIDDYPISTSFNTNGICSVLTDTALCSGNTLGLATNIDETIEYLWNTGTASSHITITESGDYALTTTNSRGCRAANSIHVNILGEAPEINFNIDNLCFKDSTSFVGNAYSEQGIESYLWIIDDTDSISSDNFNYVFASAGVHNIRAMVTSNNTCRNDISFNIIIKEIPYPNFTYTPVCTGIPMNFIGNSTIPDSTSIESYTWLINDSIIGTNENLTFGTDNAGIVPLKYSITLSTGCQSDTTINISISNEYSEPRYVSPAYPTNGMLVSSDSITFSWNYDYDVLYYNLITSSSDDFCNTDTIACTSNNITLPSENFTDTTYWKVTSYNHCLLSFESEPYLFKETKSGSDFISSNPNLQLWLCADSVELTDGKVSRWYDLSHNSFNIYGPSANRYPDIKENAINGLPAITFNGTTQDLYSQNILNIGQKGWSYFIIAKSNNDVAIISKYDRRNSDWNILPMWFIDRNRLLIREPEISIVSYTNAESQKYQLITTELYDRINFTHKTYCNSILQDTQNHTATTSDEITNSLPFRIGRNFTSSVANNSGVFYDGEIAEILAFDTISDKLRNSVHDYLYSKYIVNVSLGLDIHIPYGFCDTAITTAYTPDFISYQWSTGETDSIIHVNRSGRYTVTVTNSFGVTSTDDINVYFPEHFQLQDTTICAGDTIYWNLKMRQDEYSFQWYKDGAQLDNASNQIEISEAGAYTCLITDSLGCSFQTDTLHLAIDNYPISAGFENSDTTLCYGNRLHIVSNYEGTASAIWNDGTIDLEHYLTQPGIYTVTTTNTRGCTATNSINVNIQGRVPTPNFSIEGHCQNAEITTTNLSTSEIGEISLYRWYANDSLIGTTENISHSFDDYGTQSLKLYLETSDHCFNDTTIPIYIYPQPKPDFSPKHFCQNALTEISARTTIAEGNIINHLWNLGDDDITGENITNTFESYGIKTITLSAESEQGCIGTKDIEVNVLQAEMPATEISGVCLGHETTFINKTPFNNINPQTAWEWEFGDDMGTSPNKNTTHTYDTTGTYNVSLTVSFANHCSTTTDTTIIIHELPEATITANDGCVGTETTLNAEIISVDNIVTHKWQIDSIFESSEQRPTFVSDTTGTFAVTLDVLTEFSCPAQATDSIIIHGKPDVAFTQSREWGGSPLYVEFENTSEGATSYHWDFGDAGESSQTNPYFIFTEPGTYEVSLTGTNEFGCSSRYKSSAITVVEPIVDIMLMDLKANEENGFAKISLIIVNLGTLPVEDLVLELKVNNQIYHETIGLIAQGAVVPHTFGTMIPIPNSASIANTICVEAIVQDVEGHSDMNLANNTICITDAENLSVGIPYPIPAREQITCDIYTKIPTDLDISLFNIFGKLVKHEQINQHKGYLKYVVNITDLAGGMYFIRVNSKDESITHKFEVR